MPPSSTSPSTSAPLSSSPSSPPSSGPRLELACFSPRSARIAAAAGASRVELCADKSVGGLTPALSDLQQLLRQPPLPLPPAPAPPPAPSPGHGAARNAEKDSTGGVDADDTPATTPFFRLPVYVMLRPHARSFVYSRRDFARMRADLEAFKRAGAAGFVFGILKREGAASAAKEEVEEGGGDDDDDDDDAVNAGGEEPQDDARRGGGGGGGTVLVVDAARCAELVRLAAPLPCTFHRAFDACADGGAALEAVRAAGMRAVLTAGDGGGGTWEARKGRLRGLVGGEAARRAGVTGAGNGGRSGLEERDGDGQDGPREGMGVLGGSGGGGLQIVIGGGIRAANVREVLEAVRWGGEGGGGGGNGGQVVGGDERWVHSAATVGAGSEEADEAEVRRIVRVLKEVEDVRRR